MCTRISANVGREKVKQQQKHRHFRLMPVGLPLQKTIITSAERPLQDCCALMISLAPSQPLLLFPGCSHSREFLGSAWKP